MRCKKHHVVLEALLLGISVRLDVDGRGNYRTFVYKNKHGFGTLFSSYDKRSNRKRDLFLNIEMDLPWFIECCNRLTRDEILAVMSTIDAFSSKN